MQFMTPPKVIFGRGTIKKIEEIKDGVIITGENTWRGIKNLIATSNPIIIFRRKGEPTEEDVESLAEKLREYRIEWIIAIGGGSVIDSAKIARIMYEYPNISWEELYSFNVPDMRSKFIAIETTTGTGTGVSAAAVVKSDEGDKRGVVSPRLIPTMAIYDPEVTQSMPKNATIYSSMDALTHAIEAYTSNVDNIISDTLALKAIELIYHNIRNSVNGDMEAREKVHYGNMLAGMGFTNSRLGLCHAAAHKIGGKYEIEHGKINAILLPYVVRANERYTERFKDVARVMGVDDVAQAIMDLNKEFGIPTRLENLEVDKLAEEIAKDRLMEFNPRRMSVEDIREFLIKVREGKLDEI